MKPTARELESLRRCDPRLAAALRRLPPYPGFPAPGDRRRTHWEALSRSIVFQQLAGKAASTIHGRVCDLTPGARFPSVEELLELPDDALRGAGLSRAKTASLRDLAERITDGRLVLRSIGRLPNDAIVARLVTVRGIGVWSAQMFLMFRLGRLDVMPSADLGVREGLRLLDGLTERPAPRKVEARAEVWAPLRSVAAWTLWRVVDEARANSRAKPRAN